MSGQQALMPVAPFWVVQLGRGACYGPFATEREADAFAASHGRVTSNFVVPVRSPESVPGIRAATVHGQEV